MYKKKRHPLQGRVDHHRRRPCERVRRAESRTRTGDLLITNELLYQLSYFGVSLDDAKVQQTFDTTKRLRFEFAFATHFTKEKLSNTDNLVNKTERPKILIEKLPKSSFFANNYSTSHCDLLLDNFSTIIVFEVVLFGYLAGKL